MAAEDYSVEQHASHRPLAMALALASAVVLSPLYANQHSNDAWYDLRWNSGLVLPMILAGLIVAIKKTSSSSSSPSHTRRPIVPDSKPSAALRVGGSSWGLATALAMLVLVLSWQ